MTSSAPLRGAGNTFTSPTSRYYARRVKARSLRRPTQFHVPVSMGILREQRKEDVINTKMDVLGPLVKDHYPVVPDSSRSNLLAAFDKRCNYYSDRRVDKALVLGNDQLLRKIAPTAMEPIEWTSELFHTWNAQFPAAKQARHLKVFPRVSEITSKEFSSKEIFVKVEALLKRHDPNWAPRIIYQSSDLHNVILGPIMQACTKRMFKRLYLANDDNDMNFRGAYSANSESLCSYINRSGGDKTKFIESDFSSNDMTQLRDVHLLEVKWLRWLGAPEWVTGLMLHANSFKVTSRKGSLKSRVTNQLPTGAQSTTFRNTMWNMTICYTFARKHGCKGDVLVLGDDMLMRLDNPFSVRNQQLRRAYEHICILAGMKAEVKVRKHLSECEFLSKQFIQTSTGFVLIPKFGKAIGRFNARASSNEAVSDASYLAGKALSYAFEFRFAPPFSRCYYERYKQLAPQGDVSLDGIGWNAKGAFLQLGVEGVLSSINSVSQVASRDDLNRFYHWRYSLLYSDALELLMASLFGEEDLDEATCGRIIEDWL